MSERSSGRSIPHDSSQHAGFLALQPIVVRHAQVVFRRYPAAEQEELIAEAVAAAFVSYVALKSLGSRAKSVSFCNCHIFHVARDGWSARRQQEQLP
jgi:hypothetical protein